MSTVISSSACAAATAEIYAKHGIPTLPLNDKKKPMVRGFKIAQLTLAQSRTYMERKPDADVLGVPDGPLSGIVRLDIDEHGDHVTAEVIRRAGEPGAITRTASGKHHLWYRDNHERRLTGKVGNSNARPWDDLKVDLCGEGGYAISPPSRLSNGTRYTFEGDTNLEDLLRNRHRLPTIKGLPDRAYGLASAKAAPTGDKDISAMVEGDGRNCDLFNALLPNARSLPPTLEGFVDWARRYNSMFGEPMTEAEVFRAASTVLGYLKDGTLRTGQHGSYFPKQMAQWLARDPHLCALLTWLRAENRPDSEFWIADGLAVEHLGWDVKQLSRTRKRAMELGWIKQIRRPSTGNPGLYVWGPLSKGQEPLPDLPNRPKGSGAAAQGVSTEDSTSIMDPYHCTSKKRAVGGCWHCGKGGKTMKVPGLGCHKGRIIPLHPECVDAWDVAAWEREMATMVKQ
jgi:hypothetical protein